MTDQSAFDPQAIAQTLRDGQDGPRHFWLKFWAVVVIGGVLVVFLIMYRVNTRVASQAEVRRVAQQKYGVTIDGYVHRFWGRTGQADPMTVTFPDHHTEQMLCFQSNGKFGLPWQRDIVISCQHTENGYAHAYAERLRELPRR